MKESVRKLQEEKPTKKQLNESKFKKWKKDE